LSETDPPYPDNIYGLTKLEGEVAIAEILPAHFTIRTSWLYSEFGNNFVKTMLRLGKERDQLGVIVDQVGSPTYGIDLAGAILDIMNPVVKTMASIITAMKVSLHGMILRKQFLN
jgi:dTDP-4-dehydrorhamnose reductase